MGANSRCLNPSLCQPAIDFVKAPKALHLGCTAFVAGKPIWRPFAGCTTALAPLGAAQRNSVTMAPNFHCTGVRKHRETRLPARFLVLLFLLIGVSARAVDVGDTYEQVLAEKGPPKSQMQAGANRLLNYPGVAIRLKDDVVVSIRVLAVGPSPTPIPAFHEPEVRLTKQQQIAKNEQAIADAIESVKEIVNQPAPSVPITPEMKVSWYGDMWFHPGAGTPDFNNVDIRKTQETPYSKYEFVSSNFTPTIAFPGSELEFNSMTKFFYTDRSVPKKKLTEAEMVEINRLYRIIGKNQTELTLLQAE